MPFGSLFKTKDLDKSNSNTRDNGTWENCCKVPSAMTIDPPLPPEYEAYIHRCGWILFVHKSTKERSWMHPVKLANFEAQGLTGPGEYGPEMWVFEKNVNYGGFYCVDYGYPPFGWIRSAARPSYEDFKIIDRVGFDEWRKQCNTDASTRTNQNAATQEGDVKFGAVANHDENGDPENLATKFKDPEWRRKYNEVKARVIEEQGVGYFLEERGARDDRTKGDSEFSLLAYLSGADDYFIPA